MLAKLIKHDLFQTGRVFIWLLGGSVVFGGVATLLSVTKDIGMAQFAAGILLNLLIILLMALMQVIGLILVLYQTNRSFFSEQGYLTFSLPASSTKLLLSRFVTNVLLLVANTAVAAAVNFAALFNISRLFRNLGDELKEALLEGGEMPASMTELLPISFTTFTGVLQFAALLLTLLLVFFILAMMIAIFVITISHVHPFSQKPGLCMAVFLLFAAVAAFLAVKWVSEAFPMMIEWKLFTIDTFSQSIPLNFTTAFVMLGISAGLFALTDWLLKKKISLK
ncbi:MAG: hypothetical protein LBQ33_01235 [Oscillospiraceae bacterium]|jgi:hypothetical protein|nr:hypothetical protein [Oscillospiraceae bacterium]